MSAGERPVLRRRIGSFRGRMRLFFVLVVVLPTIAVALLIFGLIASSERGQADARLAARQGVVLKLAAEEQARALRYAKRAATDPRLAAAVRGRDRRALSELLRRQISVTDAERIAVRDARGVVLADRGDREALLPASVRLSDAGRVVGELRLAVTDADRFARKAARITDEDLVIASGTRPIAVTDPELRNLGELRTGAVKIDGREYRAAAFTIPSFSGRPYAAAGFEPAQKTEDAVERSRWLAVILLLGFVLLAVVAATAISRSLDREIGLFLRAARRLGGGDFSAKIPTRGSDEFAQLAEEFNSMSGQLERRLDELRQERVRLARSLRRLGEAFASNLDRSALLEIVVETAVDTLGADGGRATDGTENEGEDGAVSVGTVGVCAEPVDQAESEALARGTMVAVEHESGHAMAYPIAPEGPGADPSPGVIAVWRADRPFTINERELFEYLAGQAAVSVENVGRHEVVARQAVTDPLTGLPNRRRFDQRMAHEAERARSLGTGLAVVLLDIDDFKQVNDGYGHATGDLVLRRVGEVLLSASRDPDMPGRIGGEELAVLLPGTGLDGARELAERLRERIADLSFTPVESGGEPFTVTASLGVAAATGAGADEMRLLADADAALYEAKRSGKNRTVTAG